jgi:hypothetical protein
MPYRRMCQVSRQADRRHAVALQEAYSRVLLGARSNTPSSPVSKTSPAVALTLSLATRAIAGATSKFRHANDKPKPDTSASHPSARMPMLERYMASTTQICLGHDSHLRTAVRKSPRNCRLAHRIPNVNTASTPRRLEPRRPKVCPDLDSARIPTACKTDAALPQDRRRTDSAQVRRPAHPRFRRQPDLHSATVHAYAITHHVRSPDQQSLCLNGLFSSQ